MRSKFAAAAAAFTAALCTASAGPAPARAAPADYSDTAPPSGPMGSIGALKDSAFFIGMSDQVRDGDSVRITFLLIYSNDQASDGRVARLGVTYARIDCTARTFQNGGGAIFNEDGRLITNAPADTAAKPIVKDSARDAAADIACEGAAPLFVAAGALDALAQTRAKNGFPK